MKRIIYVSLITSIVIFASCKLNQVSNKSLSLEAPTKVSSDMYKINLQEDIIASVLPNVNSNEIQIYIQTPESMNVDIRGGIVGVSSDESAESVLCDRLPLLDKDISTGPESKSLQYKLKKTDFLLIDTELKDSKVLITDRHFQMFPGRQPRAEVCIIQNNKVVSFFAKTFPYPGAGEESTSFGLLAQDSLTNTAQYAEYCYEKIKARLPDGPYKCRKNKKIPFNVNGVQYTGTTVPPACDAPSWLESDCTTPAHAYMQRLETTSNDVEAILMCRHKTDFSDADDTFNDIAIVMHNNETGGTCWFQGLGQFHADKVVAPHQDTGSQKFWLQPNSAKEIQCANCHDSGPWMNSPHALASGVVPEDGFGKYWHIGAAFKDNFAKPQFIDVGDYGLGPNNEGECTSCHKIGKYTTCLSWIDQMTGKKFAPNTTEYAKQFENRIHMPPDHGFSNQAEFDSAYGEHLKAISACCQASYNPSFGVPAYCKIGAYYDDGGNLVQGDPYPPGN